MAVVGRWPEHLSRPLLDDAGTLGSAIRDPPFSYSVSGVLAMRLLDLEGLTQRRLDALPEPAYRCAMCVIGELVLSLYWQYYPARFCVLARRTLDAARVAVRAGDAAGARLAAGLPAEWWKTRATAGARAAREPPLSCLPPCPSTWQVAPTSPGRRCISLPRRSLTTRAGTSPTRGRRW